MCIRDSVGRVKIQTTSKNSQRYYTTKRLMRDLLSNTPNFYVCAGEFRGYIFTGNAWQKYARRNGICAGNPAHWLVNSSRTRQTGFRCFDHAITGAIYFTFHNGKKIVFGSPKLQIFSLSCFCQEKNVEKKFLLTNKIFFRSLNQIRRLRVARKPHLRMNQTKIDILPIRPKPEN